MAECRTWTHHKQQTRLWQPYDSVSFVSFFYYSDSRWRWVWLWKKITTVRNLKNKCWLNISQFILGPMFIDINVTPHTHSSLPTILWRSSCRNTLITTGSYTLLDLNVMQNVQQVLFISKYNDELLAVYRGVCTCFLHLLRTIMSNHFINLILSEAPPGSRLTKCVQTSRLFQKSCHCSIMN